MTFIRQRAVFVTATLVIVCIGLILMRYKGAGEAIGTSLLAAGIVSVFSLWEAYAQDGVDARRKRFEDAGLRTVHQRRNIDQYEARVGALARRLDVTGYSLRAFLDSHGDVIKARAKMSPPPNVRILMVDPKSNAALSQELLEGHSPGYFAAQVSRTIRTFKDVPGVHIRLLRSSLPTMVFRIDDTMYAGPYFAHRSSASSATFELQEGSWLFAQFEAEFEALWLEAKDLGNQTS